MAPKTQLPNIFKESDLWTAMGVFGLLMGLLLLVFDGLVFSVVESLFEVAHTQPYVLSAKYSAEIKELVDEIDQFESKRKELFDEFDQEVPVGVKKERNERLGNNEVAVENDVPEEKFSMLTTSCKYKKPIA